MIIIQRLPYTVRMDPVGRFHRLEHSAALRGAYRRLIIGRSGRFFFFESAPVYTCTYDMSTGVFSELISQVGF